VKKYRCGVFLWNEEAEGKESLINFSNLELCLFMIFPEEIIFLDEFRQKCLERCDIMRNAIIRRLFAIEILESFEKRLKDEGVDQLLTNCKQPKMRPHGILDESNGGRYNLPRRICSPGESMKCVW